jgi:hypothetical protein
MNPFLPDGLRPASRAQSTHPRGLGVLAAARNDSGSFLGLSLDLAGLNARRPIRPMGLGLPNASLLDGADSHFSHLLSGLYVQFRLNLCTKTANISRKTAAATR